MRVTALTLYPVKSLEGVALDASSLDARGLRGDRRWGLVDASGTKVTAREVTTLLGLTAEPADPAQQAAVGGAIRLRDRAGDSIVVAEPRHATPILVDHSGQGTARPAAPEVHEWISHRVGAELRLVWQDDTSHRPVRRDRGGQDGDTNSLADAAPILLTTGSSLGRLNEWLAEAGAAPIDHARFRPNVVVRRDGAVRRGRLGPDPHRRRHLPPDDGLRPLCHDDHRPPDAADDQGADPHARTAPEVGRCDLVRHPARA